MLRILRLGYLAGGGALVLVWVVRNWAELSAGRRSSDPVGVLGATAIAAVAILPVLACWRASVAALGSRLTMRSAAEVFLPAQLARFLPGSVWSFAAQADRGLARDIPVRHSLPGSFLSLAVSVVAAVGVGLVCIPSIVGGTGAGVLTLCSAALAAVGITILMWRPRLLTAALSRIRSTRSDYVVRPAQVVRALLWSGVAWLVYGAHALVLAVALGAPVHGSVAACVGGFALAWVVGFVAVFAPAGLGVREAMLVVALKGVLPPDDAVLLALLSRAILTLVDVGAAVVGLRLSSTVE